MKVYVYVVDEDNSCSDPECCGGPYPVPYIRVFSSEEKVKAAGKTMEDVTEIEIDGEAQHVSFS
jgi:hypothetical protein